MKIFRFDREVGRAVDQYQSSGFTISRVAQLFDDAVIHCAYLDANGVIGYHQAVMPQLFLVVQGEGWVRGEVPAKTPVQAGQAAFWEKEEWHESGTDTGMVAILIEGTNFDPSKSMPPV
jgi:hypothetical protein